MKKMPAKAYVTRNDLEFAKLESELRAAREELASWRRTTGKLESEKSTAREEIKRLSSELIETQKAYNHTSHAGHVMSKERDAAIQRAEKLREVLENAIKRCECHGTGFIQVDDIQRACVECSLERAALAESKGGA